MSETTATFNPEPPITPPIDHAELLAAARRQADERGLDDIFIVDADFHHAEYPVWSELLEYIDDDVVRHFLREGGLGDFWIPELRDLGRIQGVAGRIHVELSHEVAHPEMSGADRDIQLAREAMEGMSLDCLNYFPGYLLSMGMVGYDLEPHLARAWGRWVVDRVLSQDPRIITMIPLPLSDPEACLKLVEEFVGTPQVIGFMVTSLRNEPLYSKRYAKMWKTIEESGGIVVLHSSVTSQGQPLSQLNRYISVHAVTFPLFHIIQATNWIVNGMCERYPNLKLLFVEGGLAWVPFLMDRLDHDYNMRMSEAPLLQKRPSEYLSEDFFYTSQPLEATNLKSLEVTFQRIKADTQLLYSSDWPHWDFDPPRRIFDLPFLSEETKLNILGRNAQRLFGLEGATTAGNATAPSTGGVDR